MGSWREDASQRAQDDLDLLVGEALEMGEKTLFETGTVLPFYLGIGEEGQVTVGSLDDRLAAPDLAKKLVILLRKSRSRFRACAIVTDQSLIGQSHSSGNTDAIWVDLCHSEGPAMSCYLPYRQANDTPVLGDLGAQPATNLIWSDH